MQRIEKKRRHLVVGTRTSRLARWQSEYVIRRLKESWPELTCELRPFETRGDRTLDQPLPEIGGKGLFTAELERALLAGEIDIAVHSLKDLPVENPSGLTIGAIPEREDVRDLFIARDASHSLHALPPGATVGTSSLRRQAQILATRPDLKVRSIRGNVETRIRKVRDGEYDATVLAAAGLNRLEMQDAANDVLGLDLMLPAPGQGALAVQCRADDTETQNLLRAIDHVQTRAATTAERHFLQALGGGCSAPIAAHARAENGTIQMHALIAAPDGSTVVRVSGQGPHPARLAEDLAQQARQRGATTILAALSGVHAPTANGPLKNLRIVVTRAPYQAPELAERLEKLGATPLLFPTIQIAPCEDTTALDTAIHTLHSYDWVIFTSVNAVTIFAQRLKDLALDASKFDAIKVAAVGPATASALQAIGVLPQFMPDEFVAERVAEGLGDVSGLRILLPRAELARATLADLLQAAGAHVDDVPTYHTVLATPPAEALQTLKDADIFTFTSSSTVRNFVTLAGGRQEAAALTAGATIACIGPITAQTARELGLNPHVVPADYTIDGLVEALVTHNDA